MFEQLSVTSSGPSIPIDVALVRQRHADAEETNSFWAWLMVARWVPALLDEIVELRRRLRETEDVYRRRVEALVDEPVHPDEDIWLSELSASILGE